MIAGTLEIQMLANMARLADDMAKSKAVVGDAMKGIEGAVADAKKALGALGIGLGVGYFVSLIRGSIDAADHLNDLNKTTSIAVETLAGLKVAAKQTGGDMDSIAASINKLSVEMGKSPEKFRALGVSAKDPLEAFQQLADIFTKLDDPQQRAAVMAAALGKSWAGAAPLLAEGGQKIGEMVERGSRLSGVTEDMAKQADELNDKLVLLTGTGGLLTRVIGPLLPLLNTLAENMLNATEKSKGLNDSFSPLLEILKVVIVLGANVSFIFDTMGKDIARAIENVKLIAKGDFAGSRALGEMFRKDAAEARAALDAYSKSIMSIGTARSGGTGDGGSGSGNAGDAEARARAAAAAAARAKAFLADKEMYAARVATIKGAAAAFDAEIKTQGTLTDLAFKEAGINNQRTQEELIQQQSALEDTKLRNQLESFQKLKALADKQGAPGAADAAKNAELIAQTNAAIVANETITQAQIRAQRTITAQQQADAYNAVIGASEQAGAGLANSLRSATDRERQEYETRKINLGVYLASAQGQIADAGALQEQLALEHEARMGNIAAQAAIERQQFAQMTALSQAQTMAGILVTLTASSAQSNRKMFELNKVASVANAIIYTYEGANKAWSLGPILGPAMAALVITAGLANVAKIMSTKFGSGAPSAGGGGPGVVPTTSVPSVPFGANQPAPSSVVVNVTVNGHILDTQEFTDTILVPALKDAIDNRDVKIIGANSRQAADLVAG